MLSAQEESGFSPYLQDSSSRPTKNIIESHTSVKKNALFFRLITRRYLKCITWGRCFFLYYVCILKGKNGRELGISFTFALKK